MSLQHSSESEEEEVNPLMKEAADCDYVKKLYTNKFAQSAIPSSGVLKPTLNGTDVKDIHNLSHHQVFLAKRLSERLDNIIKVVNKEYVSAADLCTTEITGIKLLADSVCINELEEDKEDLRSFPKPNVRGISENELRKRAKEAAVSPEWVLSEGNTTCWKSYKPKVAIAKATKMSKDSLECKILSSNF